MSVMEPLLPLAAPAASHETNRPRTPTVTTAEGLEKENEVAGAENITTPHRKASVKPKTETPDVKTGTSDTKTGSDAKTGETKTSTQDPTKTGALDAKTDVKTSETKKGSEANTPSKIARPMTAGSRDPALVNGVETEAKDTPTEEEDAPTEQDTSTNFDDDKVRLVDGPADTQGDLAGFPGESNGSDSLEKADKAEAETDGKFPGWDEYPILSIDENDRESRARERRYYRAYGVRFAPWNIPFKRRLQTLAVLVHSLSIASTVSFFFFLCAIPLTWPLLIPYLLHMLLSKAATDGRLRFRSERFRRAPIWKFFADYYPARLHKTHDLPPTRKYIFGYHPHGIISHGAFAAFATEALGFEEKFPGITNSLLTLDSNFRIPLYREYILSLGIQSVSKESITNILTRGGRNGEGMGRAATIVIGGARESLEAQPGTMHLVLGERKGFVKLAVRTGADLVPVLAFGENDLYDQVSPKTHPSLHRLQMWVLRTLKFTLPFLHGRGIFNYDVGLMPYRRPLNIVVGKPIKVKRARGEVDMNEVERLHGEYVRELRKMWDRYKDEFAAERDEEMVILK